MSDEKQKVASTLAASSKPTTPTSEQRDKLDSGSSHKKKDEDADDGAEHAETGPKKDEEGSGRVRGEQVPVAGPRPRGRRVTTMTVDVDGAEDVQVDTMPGEVAKEIEKLKVLPVEDLKAEERRLLRRLDIRLMPTLFVLLILNYLDRNALASARVQGIEKDLRMKGTDFNTAISILFVGYILGQLPANLILSRSRPSVFLAGFVALWGAVSATTAAADSYAHLVVIRFFLGIVEAPYFPGALFLLSSWYTKREVALRTALLYSGSLLAGAFSGLIAAGIQAGLDGAHGLPSWRWLFIIEGSITVGVALVAIFILPDYPATTRWLSPRERAVALYRLETDAGVSDHTPNSSLMRNLVLALKDPNLYLLSLAMVCKTTAAAVTQFIPTVVATFGMSQVSTLLLTAPPYIFSMIISLLVSRLSDRVPERCGHVCVPLVFALVGFIIAASTTQTAPRYLSIFLMLGGIYGSYNVALAWISSTFPRPKEKRAAAYAIINGLANLAQVWSPYLYPQSDGPRYIKAFSVNSAMLFLCIVFSLVLRFYLKRANDRMDERAAQLRQAGVAEEDDDEAEGDAVPKIRYLL